MGVSQSSMLDLCLVFCLWLPCPLTLLFFPGWKAPRKSTELVYPDGLNTSATDEEINISFRPTPNYAALAEAATGSELGWMSTSENQRGWMKGMRVRTVENLREALQLATLRVAEEGQGMLLEVLM